MEEYHNQTRLEYHREFIRTVRHGIANYLESHKQNLRIDDFICNLLNEHKVIDKDLEKIFDTHIKVDYCWSKNLIYNHCRKKTQNPDLRKRYEEKAHAYTKKAIFLEENGLNIEMETLFN